MADDKKARELLEKIRRLPHNKVCVNCDKEAPPGGHGDICVKFGTFVCHTCKSAHQAFSHRCKSVTMSNWTTHEVLALKDEAGGGNAHARKTWLGQLEKTGLLLRPDDPLDKAKAFVDAAYNHKRYWRDASAESSSSSATTQRNHSGATPSSSSASSGVRPPTPPPAKHDAAFDPRGAAPAASAAATDFLDFAADFSSPTATATATATTTASGAAGAANDDWLPFQAGGANGHQNHHQQHHQQGNGSAFTFIAAPAPAPASHAGADFGDFMAAPPASAPAPGLMPMQQAPKPAMLSSARAFDDPFAGLHHAAHPPHALGGPGAMPMPQPRPMMGMPAAGMGMGRPMPPRPAVPGMMMGGAPGGFGGPRPMPMPMPMPPLPMGMGMGMGMGSSSMAFPASAAAPAVSSSAAAYKPREHDPFASLDAAWRNK